MNYEYPDTSMFETSGCDESEYCFDHECAMDECEDCEAHEKLHGDWYDGCRVCAELYQAEVYLDNKTR